MKLLHLGVVVHDITPHSMLVSRNGRREDAKRVTREQAQFIPRHSAETDIRHRRVNIVTHSQGELRMLDADALACGLILACQAQDVAHPLEEVGV